ncbi:DUF6343 family protein [Streptomyces sp. NPDC088725]|uniref:DUF6343 family protein n=1 Tax=Streptomyces sp. NPDC088725 TaxID=3365873 RepID=UPI0038142AC0
MRTGSEPVTARSALRMRFWLSLWGIVWTAFGTIVFALVAQTGWAVVCGVLLLVVLADLVLVVRRIRQGSRFQPPPDVPPYEPTAGPEAPRKHLIHSGRHGGR